MKKLIFWAVFLVILSLTKGNDKINPEPKPTAAPSSSTTTASTTTTTPTTTTVVPPSPNTTTTTTTAVPPSPNTTTTTTTTTTPATTTTASTTAKPTPKPTPKPTKPEVGTWAINVTGTNITCIVMKMALQFKVPYEATGNKTLNATVIVPKTATATGACGNGSDENILLSWHPADHAGKEYSIQFNFEKNDTSKKFMLNKISASFTPDDIDFPNITNNEEIKLVHNKEEFKTPLSMSYRCNREEMLKFNFTNNANETAQFIVSDLQLQAFHNATGNTFNSAEDCESSDTPGIVPIAVGVSLAILIIIVLVAYLVGRRRSQARGYLSM